MTTETSRHDAADTAAPSVPWAAIIAGLCASLVGIGLARFAYSPLIPPLIEAHWFAASAVVYLGAANLAGYLVGALIGRPMARHFSNVHILRTMMLVAGLAFLGCAFPLSVAWFFAWRFVSGVAGGAIMVLVAMTVLPHVPVARRGMASGAIFLGAGLGVAASGTLVPLLLELGLRQTWIGLGLLSLVLTAVSWFGWPGAAPAVGSATAATPAHAPNASTTGNPQQHGFALKMLYAQYALMAAGLVAMMVFLVDFVARGLGQGAHTGSLCWVLYGLGATTGPVLHGFIADRIGFGRALRAVLLVQVAVMLVCVATTNIAVIVVASLLIGTFPAGIVPLVLGRLHDIMPNDHAAQNLAWSRATIAFALFQALSAYMYSYLFNRSGGNHQLMFAIGAGAIALAFVLDIVVALVAKRDGKNGKHGLAEATARN
ncbi:YbfB/YjiJ family MFS transporter [Undibacterium sp. TJN25]|uniref:YbfB/YjiJ family MFS transporter n=1 Tax=Undibacterium sp. TJN25 TaxID=3413056 RepID=UPI003BF0E955